LFSPVKNKAVLFSHTISSLCLSVPTPTTTRSMSDAKTPLRSNVSPALLSDDEDSLGEGDIFSEDMIFGTATAPKLKSSPEPVPTGNLIELEGDHHQHDSGSLEDMEYGNGSLASFHTPPVSPLKTTKATLRSPPPAHVFKHRGSLHGSFHGGSFNQGSFHSPSAPRTTNTLRQPSLRDSIAGSDHLRLDGSLHGFGEFGGESDDDDDMDVSFHDSSSNTDAATPTSSPTKSQNGNNSYKSPYAKSKASMMERSNRSVSFADETSGALISGSSHSVLSRKVSGLDGGSNHGSLNNSSHHSFRGGQGVAVVPPEGHEQEIDMNQSLDIFVDEEILLEQTPHQDLDSSIHLIRERDEHSLKQVHGTDEDDSVDYDDIFMDTYQDEDEEDDQAKQVRKSIFMAVGGMGAMAVLGWSAKKIMSKMGNGEDPGDLADAANGASEMATHATQEAATETATQLATDMASQAALDASMNASSASLSSASTASFSTSQSNLAIAGAAGMNNGAGTAAAK
jgi:hypothetical protein